METMNVFSDSFHKVIGLLIQNEVHSVLLEDDDLSSISGSDTEKEDTLDTNATAQGKIFLRNDMGQVFSMYRCLLRHRKEVTDRRLTYCIKEFCMWRKPWTILMLGGGHFAGAVFVGNEPILHKTFHCYMVRAGERGSQSSRDNRSGRSQPKSAGASLRRCNEQEFVQHVKTIIKAWKPEIDQSPVIIYRASGPYNRHLFFRSSTPVLDRSDKRLRTVPFATRRATYTEVKRVHAVLTVAEVYKSLEDAKKFSKQKSPEQNKTRSACINRAKSRKTVERPLPGTLSSSSSAESGLNQVDETPVKIFLSISNEGVNTNDTLREFEDSLTPEQRKKMPKKKQPKKSKTKKLQEKEDARKADLLETLSKGNLEKLKKLLENHLKTEDGENGKASFVNEVLDDSGNTLLHIAALNEHEDVVMFLLENEADPCLKNKNQFTAYSCTQSREIREALKQFARDNPEKYNYNKAQIPVSTLTLEEIAEKKGTQRKAKRKKEKKKEKSREEDPELVGDSDSALFLVRLRYGGKIAI